ncbi:MAG: hypothetical protein FWE26_05155 [Coriobacteriia bacterium]|nr:hypothetical protein [Coriobacteriia bacterium]MCL2870996.1 hypothetical protein [Coriobacteriia bacterium]
MSLVRKALIVLLISAASLLVVGCQSGSRVFDPHVGTWEGHVSKLSMSAAPADEEYYIQVTVLPGGILSFSNLTTGYVDDFAYFAWSDDEEEGWSLRLDIYPVDDSSGQQIATAYLSHQAEDVILFSPRPAGLALLNFSEVELWRVE